MDQGADLAASFQKRFGRAPSVREEAPGRVNWIGEHTDYSGGFVLPAAVPLRCRVALSPRDDATVRLWSANRDQDGIVSFALGKEKPGRGWADHVQGLTRALAARGEGTKHSGFDLAVDSDLPLGGGLASSAALEVATLRALRTAFALALDDVALAQVGRRSENEFVGAPVGIMDQMAASLGSENAALFLDTRSLAHERVPIPAGAEAAVLDTGLTHEHAKGGYRTRRGEVDEATKLLGVETLRDLLGRDVEEVVRSLPEPLGRRVRHILTENERVLAAVQALRREDLPRVGELLCASHRSLRDDFEVSTPELDAIVELALKSDDTFGARLTGGGFGGSVLIVARRGTARRVGDAVAAEYSRGRKRPATVRLPVAV